MIKHIARMSVFVAALTLACCASGPKFGEIQSKLPPLSPGQGRVYFYRNALLGFGSAIQSDIKVNNQTVGKCTSNSVFFADLPPGNYQASVTNEVERTLNFTIEKGEEKFVRCYLAPTIVTTGHLVVELVDPAVGRAEIQDLAYTGAKLN